MEIRSALTIKEKLKILTDAAKYDVACTSSGSERGAVQGAMGSTAAAGICHSFAADGRCISLLKILYTNVCIRDCRYCVNRRSRDTVRTSFTPEEICTLTMEFYRRNYIEGLFLSSGIIRSPDYTMEQLYETLFLLRHKYHFMGYIHVKGIPGADPALVEKLGFLVDRMSFNLEFASEEGLETLAPGKTQQGILGPIRHVQAGIQGNAEYGRSAYQTTRMKFTNSFAAPPLGAAGNGNVRLLWEEASPVKPVQTPQREREALWLPAAFHREDRNWPADGRPSDFVPAGQSTQMIIGANRETDFEIMMRAEQLYQEYTLKRVFYSAFLNTTHDSLLPETPEGPPLLREHRLYQADFLLRNYGFFASELLSPDRPFLHPELDPKCGWALRHLEHFPVEVSRANYETLLRVPGIGVKSAERIVRARRSGPLSFDSLKKMGVVLKRAHYFILLYGRQLIRTRIEEGFITRELISMDREKNWRIERGNPYRQMDLFRDGLLQGQAR